MASCLTARQKLVSDGLGATVAGESFCSLTPLAAGLFPSVIRQAVLTLALSGALGFAGNVLYAGSASFRLYGQGRGCSALLL